MISVQERLEQEDVVWDPEKKKFVPRKSLNPQPAVPAVEPGPERVAQRLAQDDVMWDPLAKKFVSREKVQEAAVKRQSQIPGPETAPPEVDLLEGPKEAAKALGRGVYVNLPQAGGGLVEGLSSALRQTPGPWMAPDMAKRLAGQMGLDVPVPTPLEATQQIGGAIRETTRQATEGGFLQPTTPREGDFFDRLKKDTGQTLVEAFLENTPQLLVTVASTAATGGLGGLISAFGLEFGNAYDQAKQENADEPRAVTAAVLTAAPNALLERIVPGGIVKKAGGNWSGITKAIKEVGLDILKEGSTESLQSFNQELAAMATYAGENGLTGEDLKTLVSQGNLRQYLAEGVVGSLTAGPISAAAVASTKGATPEPGGGTTEGVRTAEEPPGAAGDQAPGDQPRAKVRGQAPEVAQPESTTDEASRAGEIVEQQKVALADLQRRMAEGSISETEAQQRLLELGRVNARLTDQPMREMAQKTEEIGQQPAKSETFDEQRRAALATLGITPSEQASQPQTPAKTVESQGVVDQSGPKDTVVAGDQDIPVRWAVVDVDQLRTSHVDAGGALQANPEYDAALQPRDRSRIASGRQVSNIATNLDPRRLAASVDAGQGAPIVGPDMAVESGNVRTLAIRRAYEEGAEPAARYRQMVETEAQARGLEVQAERPVLVRVREGEVSPQQRQELTRRMNESQVARMAPAEQATADAQRLTSGALEALNPTETGEISLANSPDAVRSFLRSLPETEGAGLMDSRGQLNLAGERRLRSAVLAKALGDAEAVERLIESTDSSIANLGRAVVSAAPALSQLRDAMAKGTRQKSLDLAPVLADVANELDSLRRQGKKVTDELAQDTLFGQKMDPAAELLLRIAGGDTQAQALYGVDQPAIHRSAKRLGALLRRYVELVDQAGDPRQKSLMKGAEPTRIEVLKAALDLEGSNQGTLFRPRETEGSLATGEAGFVEVPATRLNRWLRKWWTTTGLLPQKLHEVRRAYHHRLAAHVEQIEYFGRELSSKIRSYKGPLSQKQLVRYLDDAYRGMNVRTGAEALDPTQVKRISRKRGVSAETLSDRVGKQAATGLKLAPEFLPLIGRMRAETDALTRTLRRQGLLTDESARELERSHGLYVNRAYRAFNDPKWKERVKKQPMWNRFADILAAQVPDLNPGQIEGMMAEYVSRIGDSAPALPGGIIEGSKQMGPLRQRKGLEDMRRMLLGEYRDIRANYGNTLAHMAQLVEAHRMMTQLEEVGRGEFFLERPEVREGVEYTEVVDPRFYQETLGKLAQGRVPVQTRASAKARSEALRRGVELAAVRGSGVGGRVLLTDVDRFAEGIAADPKYKEVEPVPIQGTKKPPAGQQGMARTQPLSGLYTSPEIMEDLREDLKSSETTALYRAYMAVNLGVKTAKTVLSMGTTARNLLSNSLYLTANGHSPIPFSRRAARDWATAFNTVFKDLAGASNEQLLRVRQELIALGIMDQGTDVGDLRRISREGKVLTDVPAERITNISKVVFRKAGDLYQSMDDLPKMIAFGHELATLRKAYPDKTDASLKKQAADIVRATMQNYGELPRGVRKASTHPLVAPFFSFGAELVRNAKNIVKQAKTELESDNKVIRQRGRQRLAGMVIAATLPDVFATLGMLANNLGDDEEEALRRFVYIWDRESNLQVVSAGDGKVTYFDWGWLDVWARLKEPVIALLRSDKETPRITRMFETAAEPLGEEILVSKLLDVARNKKDFGGKVYNDKIPWIRKVRASAEHVGEALEPGTLRSGRRIWQAERGIVLPSGRKLEPWQEWVALLGPRFVTLDIRETLRAKSKGFSRELSEATADFTEAANTRGTPQAEEIVSRYRDLQETRLQMLRSLRFDIQAAEVLDVPPGEVDEALEQGKVPMKYINAARGNYMEPRDWTDTTHGDLVADRLNEIYEEYAKKELEP